MQRRRTIASAPVRRASETWDTIACLVADTLERSPLIDRADVEDVLNIASSAGTMLVAGGHLESEPLVLVANPVHVSISTVSGDDAEDIDEDLAPVPGGATAQDWTLYLPAPSHLAAAMSSVVKASAHLSMATPPTEPSTVKASNQGIALDLAAVARRAEGNK